MGLTHCNTKIFLDSGNSEHTKNVIQQLGFLDGQTTNPTYLVKKNPAIIDTVARGKTFSTEELLAVYQTLAQEISNLIPHGSVSIEVYADQTTTSEHMIKQAEQMYDWIPNAHIKLPIIPAGLEAAQQLVARGMRVNMTLCFSQAQAAAVHAATRGAAPGQVFVSPFISRLDKINQNGFELLQAIQRMYTEQGSHVSILAASVHSVYDIAHVIESQMDIITIPYDDLLAWITAGTPVTTEGLTKKDTSDLEPITFETLTLDSDWHTFDINHQLTTDGLAAFAADWNEVLH